MAPGGSNGQAPEEQAKPDKVYELNLSVPDSETSSVTVAAEEFAKQLNERSQGALKVTVFPNGSLYGGDGSAAIKQVGAGGLDMLVLAGSLYANFKPEFNVVSIPYMFDDFDQLVDYVNSDVGNELKDSVSTLNIEPLALWTRSFRQITNSKRPITEPEDLKGVILRVPNNPLWVEFFTACGATATPMSFSEVYNALQLKTLDGQENPVDVPMSAKFYEVQSYITMSNHMADTWVVGMSSTKFNGLPEDLQQLVTETAQEMQTWKIDYDTEQDALALQLLIDNGMEMNELTAEGQAKFVEVSKGLYDSVFKGLVSNDDLFNKTLEFVGKN
ncbi:DctP family TRAP transporter solute-binding subunit [Anaerotalea alkaliphila]|uniref:DctP family TRAP transporter solute-binding subunit n=1 Tax=Anaerotalea alkaliphila TaxID=2662126 RepID=UPI0031B57086